MQKKDLRYDIEYKRQLFERYKKKQTEECLYEIICTIKDLIYNIILKTIKNKHNEHIEDIFNDVLCEIIPAIVKYDPSRGCSISNYLHDRIRFQVIKSVHDLNLIRIPDYMFDKLYKINKFIDTYVSENEKYPDIEVISSALNVDKKEIQSLSPAIYGVYSLDFSCSEDNPEESKVVLIDRIIDAAVDSSEDLDNMIKKTEIMDTLKSTVSSKKIKQKHMEMVVKYFYKGLTYREIAKEYLNKETGEQITKQCVEQCINKSIRILREEEKLKQHWATK